MLTEKKLAIIKILINFISSTILILYIINIINPKNRKNVIK
jgi:hypothetical protein